MKHIIMLALLLVIGCSSTKPISNYFPPVIADQCVRAMAESKASIEACGTPLKQVQRAVVVQIDGQIQIDGRWAYKLSGYQDIWAGGSYDGMYIQIVCDPNNRGSIEYGSLYHEFGHYWLVSNYNEYGHPAKYDKYFGWSWIDDYLKVGSLKDKFLKAK